MSDVDRLLIDIAAVDANLRDCQSAPPVLRAALADADETLAARFREGAPASELVPLRAQVVDQIITRLWHICLEEYAEEACLAAVGGYGRGELHPASDIDVMILIPESVPDQFNEAVSAFVTSLWDIGLEVGHSVRSIEDCKRQAADDITIATNLMESRPLAGNEKLFQAMQTATSPFQLWPGPAFFEAKWQEQQQRHERYHDTSYNLEPNIKESPGGLRDIHMVGWVAKRHFNAKTLHDLVHRGFLEEAEYDALMQGQYFLWDVRFALHLLAGRREDRLLFEYQTELAKQFGYQDADHTLGVEQFMQRYYRVIMQLNRLNELLLQLYQEAILYADIDERPELINKRFQIKRGFLEVTHRRVFTRYPFAMLELFLLIEQRPEIKGVRAATIRLLRQARNQIDDAFRADIRCRSLFMEILRQPQGLTHALRRMHHYGILSRYIPAFAQITGRMQYDLYHVYTVDTHTLMVVRNLRRLAIPKHQHEFPLLSRIYAQLPKPELLYLAGLFHDIAKGRGGDHSELGAEDTYAFCLQHGLSRYDCRLVAWLVRKHLLMSMTAQRRDISDPAVIDDFAQEMGDQTHLNYLYLLTVADIRATNPSLWNSWRGALLLELYRRTQRALRRGLGQPIEEETLVAQAQATARELLRTHGLHHMTVRSIWRHFTPEYFLRYSPQEVVWHTRAIHAAGDAAHEPLILVDEQGGRGGIEIFIYTRDQDNIFALAVAAIDRLNLDIQDARIITTANGYTVDSFLVLGENVTAEAIKQTLSEALKSTTGALTENTRPLPRRLRHFTTATEVDFAEDAKNSRTAMELITGDQPGLLARIGQIFATLNIRLQNAKIATIGERAEDVFFVTDQHNDPLSPAQQQELRAAVFAALNDEADLLRRGDGV
ncbi:[protein-PII] uridylyltransferase [Spiribacter salilacus]|uniref:[protein-PII] uridylyltransferase n=1 Tax=Spiribacter salilacus TaxID=2664894 RepID=UPI00350E3363